MPSDEMVEKACAAYWEHYREAWRPSGTLPAKYDVPFADLPPNTKHLTAKAMEAALDAAEAEKQPVAWRVHDWADGWILFDNEARARHEADNSTGVIEPLFATAIRARWEALPNAKRPGSA